MDKVATKKDWKTKEMPTGNEHFILHRDFNEHQISNLKRGNIPQEMEDKWFYYWENNILYVHRSWTGICIYIIKFDFNTNDHDVIVNRNKSQYNCISIEEDKNQLNRLLDYWSEDKYDYYTEWLEETLDILKREEKKK